MVKICGQNKGFGDLETATKFWSDMGVDGMMIKRDYGLHLTSPEGKILKDDFRRMGNIQKDIGLYNFFHIHPYDGEVNINGEGLNLDALNPVSNSVNTRLIKEYDNLIQKYDLNPLITLHLAAMETPKYNSGMSEEHALEESVDFARNLNHLELNSKIAFENSPDPGRNGAINMIGNKIKHLKKVLRETGNIKSGVCIDTGHDMLSEEKMTDYFIRKKYPIYSVHLHTNDGVWDDHKLPSIEYLNNKDTKSLLKASDNVVLEIKPHKYDKKTIEDVVKHVKRM